MTKGIPVSEDEGLRAELRSYAIGGILSLALTGAAFWLVASRALSLRTTLLVLGGLAIVQIAAQLRFFLHIDLRKSHRDDLQLILFTALIIGLMIGGTIWILFNQHARM
ncbi:cytochrome o ubiquinol oxidase subunit IV [Wenxinia saemankumensis]|uniref:Cytochrome bo(3) ubiquinol oxidase subunit 4 n=1 Tax=Wenxinia saemankumensis TaxID=1447782 RepID=A0A1M6A3A7_9RHOB|nr:cytochrome o ubiquinol oxidase subunit IV [Wenxinia saemankumensis]SHI30937.1 cytochrome bo3 quinol oxidase subunit 4 [Wenxinia saemankumensis]